MAFDTISISVQAWDEAISSVVGSVQVGNPVRIISSIRFADETTAAVEVTVKNGSTNETISTLLSTPAYLFDAGVFVTIATIAGQDVYYTPSSAAHSYVVVSVTPDGSYARQANYGLDAVEIPDPLHPRPACNNFIGHNSLDETIGSIQLGESVVFVAYDLTTPVTATHTLTLKIWDKVYGTEVATLFSGTIALAPEDNPRPLSDFLTLGQRTWTPTVTGQYSAELVIVYGPGPDGSIYCQTGIDVTDFPTAVQTKQGVFTHFGTVEGELAGGGTTTVSRLGHMLAVGTHGCWGDTAKPVVSHPGGEG